MDDATYNRRLGFWLRSARERAGLTQETAATELGLAAASKSTVSDWEAGLRPPSLLQLRRLAELYIVPVEVFTSPRRTPTELLDALPRVAERAGSLERDDWEEAERGARPPGGDEPSGERQR
jgi:transcriptional regulator with XRE-family HTH domain